MKRLDKDRFVALIADGLTAERAARRLGVSRQTVYRRAKADPEFAARIKGARPGPTHGLGSTYASYGCRCEPCTRANTERVKEQITRRSALPVPDHIPHGRASTYTNWGCRCEPCREAHAAQCADWKRRHPGYSPRKRTSP